VLLNILKEIEREREKEINSKPVMKVTKKISKQVISSDESGYSEESDTQEEKKPKPTKLS